MALWIPVEPSGTGHTAASNASPASAPPAGSAGLPPPLAQKSSLPRKRGIQLIMAIPPGTSHAKEIQHEKQSNLTRNSTKQSAFEHVFLLRLGEEGLNTSWVGISFRCMLLNWNLWYSRWTPVAGQQYCARNNDFSNSSWTPGPIQARAVAQQNGRIWQDSGSSSRSMANTSIFTCPSELGDVGNMFLRQPRPL